MVDRRLASGGILNARIFTVKNLVSVLLVASVLLFTFYMRLNISSELAYINVFFYLAVIVLASSLKSSFKALGATLWVLVVCIFSITEISAGVGWRDILKFFFLYCAPLLVCQLQYEGKYEARGCARTLIEVVNFFVIVVFVILVLDLMSGSAVMNFLASRLMPGIVFWIQPGVFDRHASIWGQYLVTAGFYMVFLFMNVAYAKVEGEYLIDVRLLYAVATIGVLSTGGKTALVIYLVSIVWLNITGEHRMRNAVVLTTFLLALYFLGAFDIALERFGAEDLSSGRNNSTVMMLSQELPGLFSGYGENFSNHAIALIGYDNAAMFSEYSLLALAYKFGLVFVALSCFLMLKSFFAAAYRTRQWAPALMGVASLAYFASFNGLLVLPDTWNMLALYALVTNLLSVGEAIKTHDSSILTRLTDATTKDKTGADFDSF